MRRERDPEGIAYLFPERHIYIDLSSFSTTPITISRVLSDTDILNQCVLQYFHGTMHFLTQQETQIVTVHFSFSVSP